MCAFHCVCVFVCVYLAGVQPVSEARLLDTGDQQPVDHVLGQRGDEGEGHTYTQHHKQTREVPDPHLQRLGQRKRDHQREGGDR